MTWRRYLGRVMTEGIELTRRQKTELFWRELRLPGAKWRLALVAFAASAIGLFAILGLLLLFFVISTDWIFEVSDATWDLLSMPFGLSVGLPAGVVVWLVVRWLDGRLLRRHRYRALHSLGFECCAHCNYWMHGLPAEVENCPECGENRPERTCHLCGYSMRGHADLTGACPECGAEAVRSANPRWRCRWLPGFRRYDSRIKLTETERNALYRRVGELTPRHISIVLLLVSLLACTPFAFLVFSFLGGEGIGSRSTLLTCGCIAPAVLIFVFWLSPSHNRAFRRALREQNHDLCIHCGTCRQPTEPDTPICIACGRRRDGERPS